MPQLRLIIVCTSNKLNTYIVNVYRVYKKKIKTNLKAKTIDIEQFV